ncbi:hypothetical protein BBJ29_003497 [Phytophthora kernoviae]|uniref:histone acetyltransferase n=1 Tax=Phytophthora kernoviae TaxID=325452 RepID=A0A3F2RLM2_9STRA|nr:hypothetical protein BBJ29_003497 [Phytophthora kernoviae]RLN59944.1 hypothetical protein BBP00_00006236 [Phytophthora kernoviae]
MPRWSDPTHRPATRHLHTKFKLKQAFCALARPHMGLNETRALERGKSPASGDASALHDQEEASSDVDADESASRSPDASGLKRALPDAESDASHTLCDRPCEKKLKREDAEPSSSSNDEREAPRRLQRRHAVLTHKSVALSPLNAASATQIRQHLCDVRREVFLRPMLAIVSKLMFHKANHGFFNVRVDPVAWKIPHYFEVVKSPMDLALVKNKCLDLEYETANECAQDIRLVFNNACLFNPPGHVVHEAAAMLLKEFETEYKRYRNKAEAAKNARDEHSCPFCLNNVCGICYEKCINFEPPFVLCSGACRQRIKRHAVYYKTPNGHYHWCSKCFTSLPKMLTLKTMPSSTNEQESTMPAAAEYTMSKLCLLKSKFLDELTEPWVQCDHCNGWVHQICALFNACEDADEAEEVMYICPLCRLEDLEVGDKNDELGMSPTETSVEEFPVKVEKDLIRSHSPALKQRTYTKDFTRALGFDEDIEEKVFDYLTRVDLDAVNASTTTSFVKSQDLQSCKLSCFMEKWVQRHLGNLGEHDAARSIVVKVASSIKSLCHVSPTVRQHFQSASQEYPQVIDYTSKAIFVFQMINGVEVCIFSMYVQEYDKHCQSPSNRNRTYIAYIDSLVYMRPRHKNPGKERLLQWYVNMAKTGKQMGIVFACEDLYAREFEHLETTLAAQLPPYFDGDYWPTEAERLAASPPKRGRLTKEAYAASVCGAKFRKRVIDSVKSARESLFVIALQPACMLCKQLIVNAVYWCAPNVGGVDVYYCANCQGAATTDAQTEMRTEVPPLNLAEACSSTAEDGMSCPFLDYRPNMLKNCEEHHYQFDSFRRAKYSTMMLVYQISSTQRAV